MKNKRSMFGVLGVIGFVILTAGIIVGTILVQQKQDIRERAAPATTVYISPATQAKNPGNTFTFSVNMDTGVNQITGVDVRLNFDPNLVTITSLQKGSGIGVLDTQINNTYDNTTGKISYSAFTVNKANAITGSAISILTVNGTIKDAATGTISFTFDPLSVITGVDEGQNVITNLSTGTIIVSAGGSNLTTTPTATATSTSGSRTATPTATATDTGGIGGGDIGGVLPTQTPMLTSTPFPVPVTGVSITTILGAGFGAIILLGSLLLVF